MAVLCVLKAVQQIQLRFWRHKMVKNIKEAEGKDFCIKRSLGEERVLSFKDHVCIGCGLCEATCPVEAIALDEVAPIERKYVETYFSGHEKIAQNYELFTNDNECKAKLTISEDKCVLCGLCSGVCPAGALDLAIDGVSIKENDAYPSLVTDAAIDEDKCLYCKKCEVVCPREAITIDRKLPNRADLVTGEIEVDEDECIYCGACAELCPAEAIVVDKETGEESIVIDKEKCVYCLVCKKACPVNAIKAVCRSCSYGEYDLDPAKAEITGNAIIDSETCIKCGWCEGVCPADAASVKQAFEGTLEIDVEKCGTCGACIDVCPCNVLSFPKATGPGDRGTQLVKEEDYCIHCGACAKACPNGALTVTRTAVDYTPTSSKSWIAAFEALKN